MPAVSDCRLWLRAAGGYHRRDSNRTMAYSGFLFGENTAEASGSHGSAGDDLQATSNGHFVMALADPKGGELRLLRTLSGGERLYFYTAGPLLWFASSIRLLAAGARLQLTPNQLTVMDTLICGHGIEGDATVFDGIHEVLPGHELRVTDHIVGQTWHSPWRSALCSPTGAPPTLAREFRRRLEDAVAACTAGQSTAAVALSGGIDSSAVAAAAAEVLGPKNVVAYTYEFADPRHSRETHYADEVCARLGIRDHRVFPITLQSFIEYLPQSVWRSESPLYWPKPFMLSVAKHIGHDGFDRYLTGFGVGSHMGYLSTLADNLSDRGFDARSAAIWRRARFGPARRLDRLSQRSAALSVPHPRLHYPLAVWLQRLERNRHGAAMFPAFMHPLLLRLETHEQNGHLLDTDSVGELKQVLQERAVRHLLSCVDVTRTEKSSRELGVARLSPAHLPSTMPFAYFPVTPRLVDRWSASALRPGKYLLRLAYSDLLPDSVLHRKKSWADAVAAPGWLRLGRRMMQRALHDFPRSFDQHDLKLAKAVQDWEPHAIHASSLSFAMFWKLLAERHRTDPPTWEELIPGYRFRQRAADQGLA